MIHQYHDLNHEKSGNNCKQIELIVFEGKYQRNSHYKISEKNGAKSINKSFFSGIVEPGRKCFSHEDKIQKAEKGAENQPFGYGFIAEKDKNKGYNDCECKRPLTIFFFCLPNGIHFV